MYDDGGLSDVTTTDTNYNHHEHNHNRGLNQNHIQNNHPQSAIGGQTEASLTRYRSAPSSFYVDLLDDFLDTPTNTSSNHDLFSQHQQQYEPSSTTSMKLEPKESSGVWNTGFTPISTGIYGGDYTSNSSTFRSMNSTRSNLVRQSSSPAGFLSSMISENGFAGMNDVEKTISSSRLNNNISFSQGMSSSSMFLPQIPENRNQIDDSTFKTLKRNRDGDSITLNRQVFFINSKSSTDGFSGHYTPSLVHHLSLPKTSSEMAVAEKLLRFEQHLVPNNTRAKRGCATHPRSIAERVRRTRISVRMKKLEELFPNMDKQTSTADMLDMAVQHIKDLQKDLQNLKDARSKCTCSISIQ
ncbi:hypothetical protein SSX86_022987 [Deinandra increscens subsp. villosa]|uniref:BHLH domain-containing protein n=1 Tax=Deinandra increscens subsp. villosa TaxID=3103831 RepID=A0AAP0CQ80_9ASTR